MGLPMISCSYFVRGMTGFPMNILPLNRSLYDQFFLYLVMAYLVFLWPAFPISAFLCLRSYIYTWHKWSSYICSSHHWFSYEQPSYHCVPIFAFLWLRLPISMSSCGKGWLRFHHWVWLCKRGRREGAGSERDQTSAAIRNCHWMNCILACPLYIVHCSFGHSSISIWDWRFPPHFSLPDSYSEPWT